MSVAASLTLLSLLLVAASTACGACAAVWWLRRYPNVPAVPALSAAEPAEPPHASLAYRAPTAPVLSAYEETSQRIRRRPYGPDYRPSEKKAVDGTPYDPCTWLWEPTATAGVVVGKPTPKEVQEDPPIVGALYTDRAVEATSPFTAEEMNLHNVNAKISFMNAEKRFLVLRVREGHVLFGIVYVDSNFELTSTTRTLSTSIRVFHQLYTRCSNFPRK